MLQSCDVSSSRVSSTVSSRAPSPSPSLMSIVFPGVRPSVPGPTTPANTPSVVRNLGRSNNLFQPICRSTSGTGLSTSSLSLNVPSAQQPNTTLIVPTVVERSAEPGAKLCKDVSVQTEYKVKDREEKVLSATPPLETTSPSVYKTDTTGDSVCQSASSTRVNNTATATHDEDALCSARVAAVESREPLHQRSRSNEIDYGLKRSTSVMMTFRSPPGTIRGFRPVSSDSPTHTPAARDLPLPKSSSSFSSASSSSSSSSSSVQPGCERESNKTNSVSEDSSRPASRVSTERISPPPWLKEFDSTLFEYFSSGDDSEYTVTSC